MVDHRVVGLTLRTACQFVIYVPLIANKWVSSYLSLGAMYAPRMRIEESHTTAHNEYQEASTNLRFA